MRNIPFVVGLDEGDALAPDVVRRVWTLRAVIVAVLLALAGRLWVLQVVRFGRYERLASANRVRLVPTDSPRGGIYDRDGEVLATCRMAYRVAILNLAADPTQPAPVDPRDVDLPRPTVDEQLAELRRLLTLEAATLTEIRAELGDARRPRFQPVVVKEELTVTEQTKIEERLWRLPDVILERVPLRRYPEGARTGHLIGYVGRISPERLAERQERMAAAIAEAEAEVARAQRELAGTAELEAKVDRLAVLTRLRQRTDVIVGINGLEKQYDEALEGDPGLRTWQVNSRNEPVELVGTTDGQAGGALILNLDMDLQRLALRLLGGRRGGVVAIDPRDGAVLCCASSPGFDPNLFIPRISTQAYRAILNDPDHPLQNRAVQNAYPPGSTFKMVSASAGLVDGVVSDRFGVSCPGGLRLGRTFKKCWDVHGGGIGLTRAIAVSCDTFFYAAALRMGPEPIRAAARAYGLGQPTGIDLPDERSGRVPDEAWHVDHHDRPWSPGDTANISIGQGDIAATVLQMAHVTATVAQRGQAWRPRVVREIRDRTRTEVRRGWQPEAMPPAPIPPEQLERVRAGMRAAVTGGTARVLDLPGVVVAGKTGSAEDPPRRLPHAWIVGFAPYDDPVIAVAVLVENSGHGSENAGPIAREVMALHLGPPEPST